MKLVVFCHLEYMDRVLLTPYGKNRAQILRGKEKTASLEEYLEVLGEKFDRKVVSFCICVIVQIEVQMLWYRGQTCRVLCIQLRVV